jgi:hypothetical protein
LAIQNSDAAAFARIGERTLTSDSITTASDEHNLAVEITGHKKPWFSNGAPAIRQA